MQKKNLTAKEFFSLAIENHKKKEFVVAKKYYEEVLKTHNNHCQTHNNLGLVFKELNQLNNAIKCFKKAIEIEPAYVVGINNLAQALQETNHLKESAEYYEKSIHLNPNKKETFEGYSKTLFKLDQHLNALNFINKANGYIRFTQKTYKIS